MNQKLNIDPTMNTQSDNSDLTFTFNRKNLMGIGLALLLVIAAMGASKVNSMTQEKPQFSSPERIEAVVSATKVSPQAHAPILKSTATVDAWQESQLAAQVSGRLEWICDCLETGSHVAEGTVLAKIEAVDYLVAVAQAKQALADAKQKIAEEEARSEQARIDWEQLNLGEPTNLALRLPQLETANASLERRKLELGQANRNLKRTQIKAPYAGIITQRNTNVGNFVGTGASVGTILNTEKVLIRFALKPDDVNKIDPENKQIMVRHASDKSLYWPATIERIDSVIDPKTRLVNVIAEVVNPFDRSVHTQPLRVGSFVMAEFPGKPLSGVYAVPSSAVLSDNRVYTVDANNTITIFQAEVLHRNAGSVLVRIPEADNQPIQVISEGQGAYASGLKVKLQTLAEGV